MRAEKRTVCKEKSKADCPIAKNNIGKAEKKEASRPAVIRKFHCRRCGKLVEVKNRKDFRTKFCSQECEKAYWKHSHKKRPLEPIFRFYCEGCGTLVVVSEPKDKRTRFCCADCRNKWNNEHLRKIRQQGKKIAEAKIC